MIIYKITNLINDKIYVGQQNHNKSNYYGSGKLLKQAILKYGKHNFKKETLQICDSVDDLDKYEIYWIKELNATDRKIGYNICDGGRVNRNMSGENHPMYGKTVSPEMRKKISEATKKGMTAEICQKIKDKRKFQIFSDETRKMWSEHRKGKSNGMYGRKGSLNPNFGVPCSDDRKSKISSANSGKKNGMVMQYTIETPYGNIIEIISRYEVIKYLNCNLVFFKTGKWNEYKIINRERINKNR